MNPILNTRAAQGLPLSAKNRRRKERVPFKCRFGFHQWEIIDDAPMDAVPTKYPPDRRVDYISPKRQCVCCLKVEWFVGPEVCGGDKPDWVDPPSVSHWLADREESEKYDVLAGSDELDDDDPLWLVDAQIRGLLEGEGATEDHEGVLAFLHSTGLPTRTVKRIHRAIVFGDLKHLNHQRQSK